MFANLNQRGQDPDFLAVKKALTVGETIKTQRLDSCVSIVRGQLLVEGAATFHLGDQCVDLTSDVVAVHAIIPAVGSASTTFANFSGAPTTASTVPALKIPYAAEIVAISAQYMHASSQFTVTNPTDLLEFSVGTIAVNAAHIAGNYTLLSAADVIVFDETDDDTHPSKMVTGLSLAVAAGDQIAIRAVESGAVGDAAADVAVTLWLRGVYA